MADTTAKTTPRPRWRLWPFWLVAGLFAVAVAKIPISGLDIWWHLRTGAALAAEPGWLATDPFSWTASGAPWPYKDIGADLLLYLGHQLLGDASLSVWPALAVLGIAGALVRTQPSQPQPSQPQPSQPQPSQPARWRWALLLLGAVVAAMQHRLHARPMLFSHVAFAWLLVWLPQLWSTTRRAALPAALAIVALIWAWAWLHRGVLVGVLTLWAWAAAAGAAWLVSALVSRHQGRETPDDPADSPDQLAAPGTAALASVLVASAASAVVFATPNGTALLTTVVSALGRRDYIDAVDEWAPTAPLTLLREHGSWLVLLTVAVFTVGRLLRPRVRAALTPRTLTALTLTALTRTALALTALALGLSVIALGASRWIPYAALAAAFALAAAWRVAPAPDGRRAASPEPDSRLHTLLVPLLIAGCLLWVAARGGVAAPGTLAAGRFPTAALDFARAHALPPRVINAYDFGGYALWRGRPSRGTPRLLTEVDGRADMVFTPQLFRQILSSHHDPRAFAIRRAADGATWVLAPNRPGDARFAFLPRDPAWCLVHWSSPARIWLSRAAHPGLCRRLAYRVFTTPALDATAFVVGRSEQPAAVASATVALAYTELARMMKAAPADPRPRIAEVVLQHALGHHTRRDQLLELLVQQHGQDAAVLALLRRLTR